MGTNLGASSFPANDGRKPSSPQVTLIVFFAEALASHEALPA